MKNILINGIILALFLIILPVSATTWYVDVSGGGNFTDIQSAIDAASPSDTIIILPGMYTSFYVTKPYLTIKGSGANQVTVDCLNGKTINIPSGSQENVTGTVVDSFTINGNSTTGIQVGLYGTANDSIVRNCIIRGMKTYIPIYGTNITFENNTLMDPTTTLTFGIRLYTKSINCKIYNNKFINITTTNGAISIQRTTAINNFISGNDFNNNQIYLSGAGINNQIYLNNNISGATLSGTAPAITYWNSTTPLTYTYKGASHTGYPGNFWSNYTGTDTDDDGIIDTPNVLPSSLGTDYAPLVGAWKNGEIISPAVGPVANFTADIRTGTAPLTVTFTDQSTGSPTTWAWDVNNDGSVDYTTQNATHTYTTAGNYTVNLTVKNAGGSDSEVKTDYITVTIPTAPVANFSANITSGTAPLTVRFTDESTNTPTSWFWDFGDGSMATTRDATHTYTTYGTRTVNLTVTNAAGSNSMVRDKYISVMESPADRARIILPAASLYRNTGTQLPVQVMNVTGGTGISFDLAYDPSVIRIDEITLNQSYASGSNLAVNATPGRIRVALTRTDGINIGSPVPVFILNTTGIGAVGVSTPLTLINARWGDGTFNYRTFDTVNGTALVYRHRGDLNGNGGIDIGDTAWTAWMVVEKTPDLIPDADFNNNGRIDIGDATKIAYYLVGKIQEL